MAESRVRLSHHLGGGVGVGLLVGAVAGGLASRAAGVSVVVGGFAAAGLLGGLTLPVGVATSFVAWLQRLVPQRWRHALGAIFGAATDDGDAATRQARRLASALGVVGAVLAFAGWKVVGSAIQVDEMRAAVEVVVMAGLTIVLVTTRRLLEAVLLPACRWFDRRVGLPFPRSATVRYTVFVAGPAWAALLPLFFAFGSGLGIIGWALGLLLVYFAQAALRRAIGGVAGTDLWRRLGVAGAVVPLPLVLIAVVAGTVSFDRWSDSPAVVGKSTLLKMAVTVAQGITDFDRDGASAWFGGGDCAPLDPARSPGRRDEPGNGIDEDCSGTDDVPGPKKAAVGDVYHGGLTAKQRKRHNVVWIVVDSLRSENMSVFGYRHRTTPYLEKLAKNDAWVFEHAFSQSTNTCLSMPSIFSGLNPTSIDWRQGKYYPEPQKGFVSFAQVATDLGYATSVSVNYRVKRRIPSILLGHQHVTDAPKSESWKSGEYVVLDAIDEIERARRDRKPFLSTIHIDDVHTPYVGGSGRPLPRFSNDLADKQTRRDLSRYDRGIAVMDNMVRLVVTYLKNEGLWDETILILTSDHGEEFLEHGEKLHSTSCHVETTRVPLVMHVPGFDAQRVATPVGLVDIVPTLVELLDFPRDRLGADGQSLLVPVLTPGEVHPDRPVFCTVFQVFKNKEDFFIHSVRSGDYFLMDHMLSGRRQLFDTRADPREKHDLQSTATERVDALLPLLRDSLKSNMFEARTLN